MPKAPEIFFSMEGGQNFLVNQIHGKMMIFLNPLDALLPKVLCSFFAKFRVWVTSGARGSVSVGMWGPIS